MLTNRLLGIIAMPFVLWRWSHARWCYDFDGNFESFAWRWSLAWTMWKHRYWYED